MLYLTGPVVTKQEKMLWAISYYTFLSLTFISVSSLLVLEALMKSINRYYSHLPYTWLSQLGVWVESVPTRPTSALRKEEIFQVCFFIFQDHFNLVCIIARRNFFALLRCRYHYSLFLAFGSWVYLSTIYLCIHSENAWVSVRCGALLNIEELAEKPYN